MIKKIILYALIAIFGLLSFSSIAPAKETRPLVRFRIETDKRTYAIGETITLRGFVINLGSNVAYIQTLRPFLNTTLTVTTPSDNELELVDDRGPFAPTDYSAVLPAEEIEFFALDIKPKGLENENSAGLEPFIESGTYKIRLTYCDRAPLLKRAVKEICSSDTIKIDILSFNELQKKLTNSKKLKGKITTENQRIIVNKKEAKTLAAKYAKAQKVYRKKGLTYLFTSDDARDGYWIVGFEEKRTGIFHAIRVNAITGKTKEIYFVD